MGLNDLVVDSDALPRTAPAVVADVLREAIIAGVLKPGEPLRQEEIAARFGVSRIPVREALRQLEGEGLVTLRPNRGAVVTSFSLAEVAELCQIRIALETLALRLAFPHLTGEDLQRADAVVAQAEAMGEGVPRSIWAANNWEFHSILCAPAGQPRLLAIIKNLHVHFDRYVRVYFALLGFADKADRNHRAILDACRARNSDRAVALLEYDIASVNDILLSASRRAHPEGRDLLPLSE